MGLRDRLVNITGPGERMGMAAGIESTAPAVEKRDNLYLQNMENWLGAIDIGGTGIAVTAESALSYSAVFAAVRILSESLAMLPLLVYRKMEGGGKERAEYHPLYELLHMQPNENMPSFQFRETGQAHLCTWGNFYSEIESDAAGRVTALNPWTPRDVEVLEGAGGRLVYKYKKRKYGEDRVLHIPGLGWDGRIGMSVVGMARRSIGYGLSMDAQGKQLIDNGSMPGGVLEHPNKLTEMAYKRLLSSWENRHQGPNNSGRLAILEEGMKYNPLGIPPRDAQFLESRKFQISEIARWFRVPPHMLADLDRATFSNIEHLSLEFVIFTLQPWLTRWEQWLTIKLLTNTERKQGFFIQFLVDGLLRGDIKSRYEAYAIGKQNGWLSTNDVRSMENLNPVDGGEAYWMPVNMMEVGNPIPSPSPKGEEENSTRTFPKGEREYRAMERRARNFASDRLKIANRQRRVFTVTARRILKREQNDIRNQARKLIGSRPLNEFESWLNEFYEGHAVFAAEQMQPVMQAYAELIADAVSQELDSEDLAGSVENFVTAYAAEFGRREANRNLASLLKLIRQMTIAADDEVLTAVEARLEDWVESKPESIGHEEAVRENNAVAVALYGVMGRERIMSVATGESSCPYCMALDGKVVGINEYILTVGDFQPEGAAEPLTVSSNKRHAPYHGGCDCMQVSV